MDKELSLKFRNKFLKLNTEENQLTYARQRKYYIKLQSQKKKQYFENLDIKSINDNKLFWKTVCLCFLKILSPKILRPNFLKKNEILTNDAKIARNSKIRFKKTCPTK